MAVSNIPAASAAGLQPKYQKFTSSGTFTLPTGYGVSKPLLVDIQVIGGGGAGGTRTTTNNSFVSSRQDYFGDATPHTYVFTNVTPGNEASGTGGSGGIAKTQMYLTGNLTITVGAAGTRGTLTINPNNAITNNSANNDGNRRGNASTNQTNGGLTTAGSVSASGGVSGYVNSFYFNDGTNGYGGTNNTSSYTIEYNAGAGGTPAGTAGAATPLLGTLAGGSNTTTPVYGSFGVGGKLGDGSTSTGVDGTGGGAAAVGASGAVILTWWE